MWYTGDAMAVRVSSVLKLSAVAVLVVLMASACGELSAYDVLESEELGPFRLQEHSVVLAPGGEYQFTATGGYRSYDFSILGGGAGEIHPSTGRYTAPDENSDEPVQIRAEDRFGASDHAFVLIRDRLTAENTRYTLVVDMEADLEPLDPPVEIEGALETLEVTSLVDTIDNEVDIDIDIDQGLANLLYSPQNAGSDIIEIIDENNDAVLVRIDVIAPDGEELQITPSEKTVLRPADNTKTVEFSVTGGSPGAEGYEVGGNPDPGDNGYTIIGPTDDGNGVHTLTLEIDPTAPETITLTITDDDGAEAQATVHVVNDNGETEDLAISPSSVTVSDGSTVVFAASGGVKPYTFTRVGGGSGQPVKIDDYRARYTVSFPPNSVRIEVTDAAGNDVTARIQKE